MGMRISTNTASINAQRNLSSSQRSMQNSQSQLASGSRINKAADDAAGLTISERLNTEIRSSNQATKNANDGISMVQIAEGGLVEITNILSRFKEHAVRSASETMGQEERLYIDHEVQELKKEVERIAKVTQFAGTKLLNGNNQNFDFQVGIYNESKEDRIRFNAAMNNVSMEGLGLSGVAFTSHEAAFESIGKFDDALTRVMTMRSDLGALQNRLLSTTDNLGVSTENKMAARSRIRDTDIALASTEVVRNQIQLQAGTATLAQANQNQNVALKLI